MTRKKAKPKSSKVADKLKLLHHASTGRVAHRRHTSYPILVILLVITGFFVFIGYNIASADGVTVGMQVHGPPPADGAVITTPKEGDSFKDNAVIDVEGTCARNTEVIVYSNDTLVGSALCSDSHTFQLQVQLFAGANNLTALNYDTLDQAGPMTPAVNVTYTPPPPSSPSPPVTPLPIFPIIGSGVTPKPPASCDQTPDLAACHPSTIDANTCDGDHAPKAMPQSAEVRVAIICVYPEIIVPGDPTIGFLVYGGKPPYAMTIDWGDGKQAILRSFDKPGYYTVATNYQFKGNYDIKLHVSDADGKQGYTQASVTVREPGAPSGPTNPGNFVQYIGQSLNTSWFDTPVPTYLLAVAVVLGFWAGDYFERTILPKRKGRHALRRKHS